MEEEQEPWLRVAQDSANKTYAKSFKSTPLIETEHGADCRSRIRH